MHASSENVLVETIVLCLEEALLVLVQQKDVVNRCSNVCGYLRCGYSAKRTLYCVSRAHMVASCDLCGIGIIEEHMVAFISEEFHGFQVWWYFTDFKEEIDISSSSQRARTLISFAYFVIVFKFL